ncbi:TolC family protein [Polynucleobacter sp. MWH-UH25E]|uniref:TolC family protein n=1 Tax=Polynucleobacter sp. MWH-UH25E TaxID=1855616 RepID=UPI001BFEE921|nr:TolC family protein [Polynucleobacter sp. MWH-UH25E]QWD61825.1 TolC family protein [Polynucleobacter sp. MWH-UH25E]
MIRISGPTSGKRLHLVRLPIHVACCALVLAGCTSPIVNEGDAPNGPEYVRWMPNSYKTPPIEAQLPRPKEMWWTEFESEELNGLVDTALTNNYDLRIAVARVAQTRAQADVVKANESPTIDATGSYKNQAPGLGPGYAPTTAQWGSQPVWQVGLLANYEVDLWGKKGFNTQSAFSQALASEYNRQAVALSLVGDTATVYFQVLSLDERIAVGERNLEAIRTVGRGLERRVDRGDATIIDLSQQLILQTNTDALVTNLKLQRERAFNRLAALVGRTPSTLKIKGKSLRDVKVPQVEPGLPSDLLCRRPDIRRAEAALESSKADLYAARANLLPTFALTGGGGYGSFLLSTLTMPQSLFYNVTTNLVQNVFDGGRRRAEIQVASAKNVELLEAYANTVLASLRDVEDGLAGVTLTAKQYEALNESRNRAQLLATMSAKVVERGGMDFVQLYEIQRTVLAAEDSAISARNDQLAASVGLFKAIGGGTKLDNDPCLGGGKLPAADARWADAAAKADSDFSKKPAVGVNKAGQPMYEGTGGVSLNQKPLKSPEQPFNQVNTNSTNTGGSTTTPQETK